MAKKKKKKKNKRLKQSFLLFGVLILFIALATLVILFFRNYKEQKRLAEEAANVKPVEMVTETDDFIDDGPPEEWLKKFEEPEEIDEGPKDTVILFAGDVLFDYGMPQHYDESGIAGVVGENLLTLMNEADITVVNEEFPFGTAGVQADKQYTFRCNPKYAVALNEMGVDVVSLANNHALDYGTDCLLQTFATLEQIGVRFAGAGPTLERAKEPQIIETNGKKIAILAGSRVVPTASWGASADKPGMLLCYETDQLCDAITKAKETCDYVFVFVHWGTEKVDFPESYEKSMAAKFAEAGADAVIGSHPHVLQGMEEVSGIPVFYSLGNFIFNVSIDKTMAITCNITPEGLVTWKIIPCQAKNGVTDVALGDKADEIYKHVQSLSTNVIVNDQGEISWVKSE